MVTPCALALLIIIFIQSSHNAAQNTGNLSVGRSLRATTNGSSWFSPAGDFAFGFKKLPNTSLFLLAIWYAKLPDTIVWYANEGNPVSEGSSVNIAATDGLILTDPQGNKLWSTSLGLTYDGGVTHGFMNDTGNFVLKGSSNDEPVWQSFDYRTDTLLPGQSLGVKEVVNSKRSETNFTGGKFQLRMIRDGNMVLNTRDQTGFPYGAYYVTGTDGDSNQGQKLIYNESGYMYVLRYNGSRYNVFTTDKIRSVKDYYQRVTLNFDGVLTLYSAQKNSSVSGWSVMQTLPDNICTTQRIPEPDIGSGICGFNSICSIDDDKRPNCECPQGYSLVDPNDGYGNCIPDFKVENCQEYGKNSMKGEYNLVHLPGINFPFNDYEGLDPSTEEDCQNSCLNDCFCAAAVFTDSENPVCRKMKAPLSNGRRNDTDQRITWIKVGKNNVSNDPLNPPKLIKNKMNPVTKVLFSSSVSVNVLFLITICFGILFIYHNKHQKISNQQEKLREYNNVHRFSYKELDETTNGFKEELGRGAFGRVYKGTIEQGGVPIFVAVKKLDRISGDTDKEFKTEVNVIGQTHHKNLVRFIGFCKEQDQRLLVYEFMSKGSLAEYLFGDFRPRWTNRIQIAQGTARGLLYLHEECSTQIIHCDIKPQNILLDENQNARISDFGLAKLLVLNQTHTNTAIRGTKGYVAPEWFRNRPVTVKVDVYSFGVVLLEIICCRKNVWLDQIEQEGAILTDWAFDCYRSNRLDSLVNDDIEALNDGIRVKRFVMIALWCVQEDPSLRPTMRTVTQMLEGVIDVPNNPPCPSSFSATTRL